MIGDNVTQSHSKNIQDGDNHHEKNSGTIYRASGGIFLAVQTSRTVPHQFSGSARSDITGFSPGSACRMRRYLRECIAEYTYMLTLTYPGEHTTDGRQSKDDLRRFMQELKRASTRSSMRNQTGCRINSPDEFSAFWFLEFQARGAPHYHIFTNYYPSIEWVSNTWYRIVGSGDERHLKAGTRCERLKSGRHGTIVYAAKYAAKQEQKACPEGYENVGRYWGVVGRRSCVSASTWVSKAKSLESGTKQSLKNLVNALNSLIWHGEAEVLKREDGVFIAALLTVNAQKKMRARLAALTAVTMVSDNWLFDPMMDFMEV